MNIASLGFKIDTSDVAKADSALDGLAATGAKTEAAAKGVGNAWTEAGRKTGAAAGQLGSTSSAIKQGNEALRAQQAELGKLLGQINPVVSALDRLDQQESKLRQFKSAGLVDIDTFREYKARIDESRNSLAGVDGAIRRTGNSSKQTAQALRQLPAQFSDIAVSLQAGQSPLQVFLQQGAQIKDSFGGVGPALRAVGGAALGMINPLTLSAAALAALAFAYKQGSDEATAFKTALILSGNAAGTTSGQLSDMARTIDSTVGTQRQAAAALAEVAGSGKFTAEQLQAVATAAVAMEVATGKAVSDTVSEFKKLADEPAAAAAKLNDQYNFLTASVYAQIAALEDQGDAAGAAQLAIETFGDAMERRAVQIEGNLGLIESAWQGIKNVAAEAWDEMLGVGREQSIEDRLAELRGDRVQESFGPRGDRVTPSLSPSRAAEFAAEEQRLLLAQQSQGLDAATEGLRAGNQQRAIQGLELIGKEAEAAQSSVEKLRERLSDLGNAKAFNIANGSFTPEAKAQFEKSTAAINKQIADAEERANRPGKTPRAPKAPAVRDDAAAKLLITLREQQAALGLQLDTETKLTAEQKKRAEFESQIADLKTKSILTADQKSLLANQDAIRAQLDKNVALAEEVRLHTDSIKLQERSAQIQSSIQSSAEGRQEQQQRNLDAFGQGRQQQEQAEAAANIFREYRRYQDQLNKNTPKDLLGSQQYLDAREEIGQGLRDALAQHDNYYEQLKEKQADWKEGASEAFANFLEESNNIAATTSELIGGTLSAVTDGISNSLARAIVQGDDLRTSLSNVATAIQTEVVASLIKLGIQYAINATLGQTLGAAAAATSVTLAGTTAAAWAPAAALASLASFGSNSVPASAALVGTTALASSLAQTGGIGFKDGGYTGNGGVNQAAGIVHGQEYVFDAEATRRIGVATLEDLRAGRDVQIGGAAAASSGGASAGAPTTIVNQMSFPGITDSREAKRSTAQASRQIARAVAGAGRYN